MSRQRVDVEGATRWAAGARLRVLMNGLLCSLGGVFVPRCVCVLAACCCGGGGWPAAGLDQGGPSFVPPYRDWYPPGIKVPLSPADPRTTAAALCWAAVSCCCCSTAVSTSCCTPTPLYRKRSNDRECAGDARQHWYYGASRTLPRQVQPGAYLTIISQLQRRRTSPKSKQGHHTIAVGIYSLLSERTSVATAPHTAVAGILLWCGEKAAAKYLPNVGLEIGFATEPRAKQRTTSEKVRGGVSSSSQQCTTCPSKE